MKINSVAPFSNELSETKKNKIKAYMDKVLKDVEGKLASNIGMHLASMEARLGLRIASINDILKEKLNETEESLADRLAAVEDRAMGLEPVEGASVPGDCVRYVFEAQRINSTSFDAPVPLVARVLPEVPTESSSNADLIKFIEQSLLGMKSEEVKELSFSEGELNFGMSKCRLTVKRVSRKQAAQEAK